MQGEYRGDFTRNTFDPLKHFSRVLMQQGRVLLDADWNEQTSILLHYVQTLAADLIGRHGGPAKIDGADNKGFLIEIGPTLKNDFLIQEGRYYVDGLLCENEAPVAHTAQAAFPLKEKDKLKGPVLSLAYLDVWERHITAFDDGSILEVALGGPDTATRAQVVAQVKLFSSEAFASKWASAGTPDEKKKAVVEQFLQENLVSGVIQPAGTGKLRARAKKPDKADEPCAISPKSGYRNPENHLYRVEIHKGGGAADAGFKWSRDNSSSIFPIRSLGDRRVVLAHFGRDIGSSVQVNDWVEVVDDDLVLRGETGPLRRVESIDSVEMSVTLSDATGTLMAYDEESTNHPRLRRWDFQGDGFEDSALPLKEGTGEQDKDWIALEDGIQIQFPVGQGGNANTYRSGDYWLIPARVATGDIQWPKMEDSTPPHELVAKPLPPHGIEHHYAPLAVVSAGADGLVKVELDCRRFF
jgi:hypothetical protein